MELLFFDSAWPTMVNVLNKILFLYLLFLTITKAKATINSNDVLPCNITNLDEQTINVEYKARTLQDGTIEFNKYPMYFE